ncbi:hypothetical protein [Ruminococcus sp.]|uniref:hypothetical protein n=1 Tax=Ruminococcus sp. TaxID=41978 RepID=UPI0025F2C76A|nr:hypothetical protein [Ruminococcus sp.]
MINIGIPKELMPENIKNPAVFIAEKRLDFPNYGIDTGDLVIIDLDAEFVKGEISVFKNSRLPIYRISDKKILGYSEHLGKVAMLIKYYGNSPING